MKITGIKFYARVGLMVFAGLMTLNSFLYSLIEDYSEEKIEICYRNF